MADDFCSQHSDMGKKGEIKPFRNHAFVELRPWFQDYNEQFIHKESRSYLFKMWCSVWHGIYDIRSTEVDHSTTSSIKTVANPGERTLALILKLYHELSFYRQQTLYVWKDCACIYNIACINQCL